MSPGGTSDGRVLITAPLGRDAALIAGLLRKAGIVCEEAGTINELIAGMRQGAGAAIVAEEFLGPTHVTAMAEALREQPPWSDFPLLVLTSGGATTEDSLRAAQIRLPLGNITLLERPVRPITLVSAVRVALRGRSRQYELRDRLEERQRAVHALFESEARYRSLVTATTSIVWCRSPEGAVESESPTWEAFTGQAAEQYWGWGWLDAIHAEDRDYALHVWRTAVKDEQVYESEFRLRHRDKGFRRVIARAAPVRDEFHRIKEWVGACTDVEHQKSAEDALIRAEKLAVAGRLAATIAHEINNPLEAVINLLFLIQNNASLQQVREYADTALGELSRVAQITTQTLSFYRQSSGASATSLPNLMDSVVGLFEPRLSAGHIRLEKSYLSSATLVCYAGEIRQVLANLLGNAIDAMAGGGTLTLRVRSVVDATSRRMAGVRITIADTGSGIPDEIQRRMFEPFFTTKTSTGTGLGLWVSSELVRKHGGTIKVRSSMNQRRHGTVFSIFLPDRSVPDTADPLRSPEASHAA
jgi:PAS domain S-box-containing protein